MAKINGYLTTTLILLALMPAAFASSGDIGISVEISQSSIAFDDKDTLTVIMVWEGEPFLYQIDDFPMPTLEKLEILGSSSSVSTASDSTVSSSEITTRTFKYILQPTDFGTGIINPLNITAKHRVTGEARELQTGRLTIEIAKPVPKVISESGNTALYLVIIVVVVVIGGAVIVIMLKRKRRDDAESPTDMSYLDSLGEIKKETVSDSKLFYSRLYRLLLSYLEKERGLDVSSKTGEEVVRIVGELEDDSEKANLMLWINQAQKVKYRPEAPSSGDVESCFNAVKQFFENRLHQR